MSTGRDREVVRAADVADTEFAWARRGYDRAEVRDFLLRIARHIDALESRVELAERTAGDARSVAARPLESLDEVELARLMGDETAQILVVARNAAADVVAQAEHHAEALLAQNRADVQRRLVDADELAAQRRRQADLAAEQVLAVAEERAATIDRAVDHEIARARRDGEALIAEAEVVRHRILEDLSRRRNAMRRQIEQLRAGRERLIVAYDRVQRTLDDANGDLSVALDDARLAAEHAGRAFDEAPMSVDDLEEEIAAARIIGHPMVDIESAGPTTGEIAAVLMESDGAASTELDAIDPDPPDLLLLDEHTADLADDLADVPSEDVAPADASEPAGDTATETGYDTIDLTDGGPDRADDSIEASGVDVLFESIRHERASRVADALAVIEAPDSRLPLRSGAVAEEAATDPSDPSDRAEPLMSTDDDGDVAEVLHRQLKRVLNEEQNLVLDLIRRRQGHLTIEDLYGDLAGHVDRLTAVASPLVDEVRAEAIGSAVAELLRRRVEGCLADDHDDFNRMIDRVRSIYRDVRSNRMGDLVRSAA